MRIRFDMKQVLYITIYGVSASADMIICRKYGFDADTLVYAGLVALLGVAAVADIRSQMIPHKLLLGGFLLSFAALFAGKEPAIADSLVGGVLCGGIPAFLAFVTGEGVGMGDAKLFAVVGLCLGTARAFGVLMLSAIFAGLAGLILIAGDTRNGKKAIPFAPFILTAVVITLTA